MFDWNKWNHLSVGKKMNSGSFKNLIYKMCLQIIYLIYMYEKDLVLNNLPWLICQTKPFPIYIVHRSDNQSDLQ